MLGTTTKVDTIWGKVDVKIKPGTVPDETIVLSGQGVNKLPPNQSQKGDHIVKIKLVVPRTLTPAHRQALEQLSKVEDKIQ